MARKKSSFYHTRWNRAGLNEQRAAEILGVSVEDVQKFDEQGNTLAERVLILWDSKAVGVPGWDGFRFVRGCLVKGNHRWRPENLLKWKDQAAELEALKNEIRRLKTWRGLSTIAVDKLGDSIRWRGDRRGLGLD